MSVPEIPKPLLQMDGVGRVQFEDGKNTEARFTAKLLENARFEGELDFPPTFTKQFLELSNGSVFVTFSIEGDVTLDKIVTPTIMKDCFVVRWQFTSGEETRLKVDFVSQEIVFDERAEQLEPSGELVIRFELVNVFQTFRVSVDTVMGELQLRHSKDIRDLERMMDSYGTPMVTSSATLIVRPDGSRTINDMLNQATGIVQDFLTVTSLAQGTWHTWVAVSVYEREASDGGYVRRYMKIRNPKLKRPSNRGITNMTHSSRFIASAWAGYSREVAQKYNLGLALEWYLEANVGSVIESKFLSATTCLELLMDRYVNETGNEYLLESSEFDLLRGELETRIDQWTQGREEGQKELDALRNKIADLNRRSYVSKAKELLGFWKVTTDDLGVTLRDIVEVRNEITHTGTFSSGDYEGKVIPAYQGLMMIIARIFMSMLRYNGQYYDWARGTWVEFSSVRLA